MALPQLRPPFVRRLGGSLRRVGVAWLIAGAAANLLGSVAPSFTQHAWLWWAIGLVFLAIGSALSGPRPAVSGEPIGRGSVRAGHRLTSVPTRCGVRAADEPARTISRHPFEDVPASGAIPTLTTPVCDDPAVLPPSS